MHVGDRDGVGAERVGELHASGRAADARIDDLAQRLLVERRPAALWRRSPRSDPRTARGHNRLSNDANGLLPLRPRPGARAASPQTEDDAQRESRLHGSQAYPASDTTRETTFSLSGPSPQRTTAC